MVTLRAWLSRNLREIVGLTGLGLTTVGAAQVYPPAGYLVPGVFLVASAVWWRGR